MADEDAGTAGTAANAGGGTDENAGASTENTENKGGGEQGADTALTKGGADEKAATSTWHEGWRQDIAKAHVGADSGDAYDKELTRLERMSNPADAYKSMRELETRVSSGELKAKSEFPAEGSDVDQAKWRQDNGVPTEAAGYLESMEGLVIGEGDKALVDSFLASSHEKNMPVEAVKAAVDWYYQTQEQNAADQASVDVEFHNESVETLREEMGPEYQRNMQDLKSWLAGAPDGLSDNLFGARLADGSLLGDNPGTLSWLVSQMREINPLSTVIPGTGGGEAMASVEQEIKDIQTMIATEPGKYWADQAKQDRFAKLISARDRQKTKAA